METSYRDLDSLGFKKKVSWIWEPSDGQRDNIAVYHPIYGQSFPNLGFKDRVVFLHNSLENPSIRISGLKMSDAGRYTCEYATYPSGNEQGTTTLVMLVRELLSRLPAYTAVSRTVRRVVLESDAWCVSLSAYNAEEAPRPNVDNSSSSSLDSFRGSAPCSHCIRHRSVYDEENMLANGPDGTVTVRSEYRLVPTPADNGRDVTCMVDQRTQERPWVYHVTLSVEYPPSVSIVGYDNNWYIGRSDAALLCLATANPEPTSVTWTTASGPLPDTVAVDGNKLSVRKVDDAVNTTFICEAKNKHGASRQQITTVVIGEASGPLPDTVAVDGNKLSVRKVDDAVNTTFICEAKNKHGASRQQITTVVIAGVHRPGNS
ncbi:putative poliovirus receptor-related protein 2-like [Scophthalmus maximus]|uniref:Putative poliovirus receptor-related protein 2-like n=1 Tax=Scophthalmus maximus TaxID=52904 RepID=A0A2U9D322_SCOMX|nr:putative poliovirus receptor-related protein 2-like [Scophthalmus maximus]